MKVMVAVKRVVDYAVKIRVKPDKSGIETRKAKMPMNPFCEIALEEALGLREAGAAAEVVAVAVAVGAAQCADTLRTALSMGADRAAVAKILKALVQVERSGLLILGEQAYHTRGL